MATHKISKDLKEQILRRIKDDGISVLQAAQIFLTCPLRKGKEGKRKSEVQKAVHKFILEGM